MALKTGIVGMPNVGKVVPLWCIPSCDAHWLVACKTLAAFPGYYPKFSLDIAQSNQCQKLAFTGSVHAVKLFSLSQLLCLC